MQIAMVGLGLIGGSLAKALRANTTHKIYGLDTNDKVMQAAMAEGLLNGTLNDQVLQDCDLVILCLFPGAEVQWLCANAKKLGGKLVTDVGGVKTEVCHTGWSLAHAYGFTFIGGHPMAGREQSGFFAAREELFCGATMLLLPDPQRAQDKEVLSHLLIPLFLSAGFGRVRLTDPETHDRIIAYTSQLAHLASSAYIKSDTALDSAGFTGGSFQDMTRVAFLDPAMWTGLFLENQQPLLQALDDYLRELNRFRDALAVSDKDTLYQLLLEGRNTKDQVNQAFSALAKKAGEAQSDPNKRR